MSESGYIADQPWQHTYHRALSPRMVRFAAAMAGIELPAVRRYCELAYGQGLALVIHAACNPDIEFAGTDLNVGHASAAAELASAAGLENLSLAAEDFAAFAARPAAQPFDVVAVQGTWTWLAERDQAHVAALLKRDLTRGGVFCLDHCTLPGMNSFVGLVRMFAALSGEADAGSVAPVEAIPDVLGRTLQLMDTNPQFAGLHWGLRSRVEGLREREPNLVAHEYFNYNARPAYFADTAALLAGAGLDWLCPWTVADGVDTLHLTPAQAAFLAGIADRARREQLRDFMHNTSRRMDIWGRADGAVRGARAELVGEMHFILSRPASGFDFKAAGRIGEVALAGDFYKPLLAALAGLKPISGRALSEKLGNAPMEEVCEALAILDDKDMLQVAVDPDGDGAAAMRTARALNRAIMVRAPYSDVIARLGSPVTGAGLRVPRHHQVFLLAEEEGVRDAAGLARFAYARLEPCGGRPLPSALSSEVLLEREADAYLAVSRPVYVALGVADRR